MNFGKLILKGSVLLSAGQILGYSASFIRNILLARVLTKVDFGIAASISLTITAFEVASKLSIGQQVVQSKHGDDSRFLATAHFCQFCAGCCGAVLIATFGGPMATLFDVPQARWAFVLVSLLSLIGGLQHLDVMRSMRTLTFSKRILLDIVPEVILTIIAFPIILMLGDYRAVVVLFFAKSLMSLGMSHLLAEQAYRWSVDLRYVKSILLFGWPLIVNALLMFGYQQGDQVLIGTNFSVASLASYSLAVSITMVPGYMFQYVLNTIMLPLLSQVKDDELNYRRRFSMCSELSTFAGVLIACFLIICGEWIIVTVFGSKYSGSGALVAWLAVANTLRIIRSVTSIAAIARADTINNMLSNIYRTTSLALAAMAVIYDKPIVWIAACGVIGEILALGASWSRLYKKCGIPIWIGLRSTCIGAVFIIFSGLLTANIKSDHTWPLLLAATIFVCTVAFIVMWRSFDESQRYLTNLLRTVQNPNLLIRVLIRFASA